MDINKMTVKELADESEDNKLMQSMIWTKAYEMEKILDKYKNCLEWYADRNNHYSICGDKEDITMTFTANAINDDNGQKARECLQGKNLIMAESSKNKIKV